MATHCSRQPRDERGEHGPVRPVQARSWVGAPQDSDLVTQYEELDVLRGGRAAHQHDKPEHLPKDQVQQPQRHAGIMSDPRSPLVSDPDPTSGTPQVVDELAARVAATAAPKRRRRSSGTAAQVGGRATRSGKERAALLRAAAHHAPDAPPAPADTDPPTDPVDRVRAIDVAQRAIDAHLASAQRASK